MAYYVAATINSMQGPVGAGPASPCTQVYGFNRVKVERRKEEEGLVGLATIG